jgi:hypothetical protein
MANARLISATPIRSNLFLLSIDQSTVIFIEPVTTDLNTYTIYKSPIQETSLDTFECNTINQTINNTRTLYH